jgi:hypothetical protein
LGRRSTNTSRAKGAGSSPCGVCTRAGFAVMVMVCDCCL